MFYRHLKALQPVSEALYIETIIWCHPYTTLLIAIWSKMRKKQNIVCKLGPKSPKPLWPRVLINIHPVISMNDVQLRSDLLLFLRQVPAAPNCKLAYVSGASVVLLVVGQQQAAVPCGDIRKAYRRNNNCGAALNYITLSMQVCTSSFFKGYWLVVRAVSHGKGDVVSAPECPHTFESHVFF